MAERNEDVLVGLSEIAAYEGESERTVSRWIKEEGYPAVAHGRTYRASKEKIKAYWTRVLEPRQQQKAS